ncbi:uncharacterized protein LOC111377300 [Olea europaea var. sylvestris]|uniref:uncharacterized protein LOC111377300 n=1 Tax=Olea europaea var. sylvestris TaxID=158386 RepID=UPI000C1D135B|nr:uncharacterized protein LOC111377300 [Olea europaea var. sylvestris]
MRPSMNGKVLTEPGQFIAEFHAQVSNIWDQLSQADLAFSDEKSIMLFTEYRDRCQFMYFMMHIRDEFENTQASLFHRSPLPTLEVSLTKLISEETQQQTLWVHSIDMVLVTAKSSSSTPVLLQLLLLLNHDVSAANATIVRKMATAFLIVLRRRLRILGILLMLMHLTLPKPIAVVSTSSSASDSSFAPSLSSLFAADLRQLSPRFYPVLLLFYQCPQVILHLGFLTLPLAII